MLADFHAIPFPHFPPCHIVPHFPLVRVHFSRPASD